jgi:phosphoserine phosphatase RsbU/P
MGLGLDADAEYKSHRLVMEPGDALLIYTDGVGECEGPNRELFGEERLEQMLPAARGRTAQGLLSDILGAVDAFRQDVAVSDDLSLMVVRRN